MTPTIARNDAGYLVIIPGDDDDLPDVMGMEDEEFEAWLAEMSQPATPLDNSRLWLAFCEGSEE